MLSCTGLVRSLRAPFATVIPAVFDGLTGSLEFVLFMQLPCIALIKQWILMLMNGIAKPSTILDSPLIHNVTQKPFLVVMLLMLRCCVECRLAHLTNGMIHVSHLDLIPCPNLRSDPLIMT